LELTIIPIDYHHEPDGRHYPAVNHDPISDWLLSVFPVSRVNVSYHAPYTFVGNLNDGLEWKRLLDEITTLRSVEIGSTSPRVYYGLIPVDDGNGQSWLSSNIAGLGWIGSRVSIGLDLGEQAGKFAGHEIGHNFGRLHAPCGNPGDVDPNFPYADGSIGEYGLDLEAELVLEPNEAMDMMGYCGPEWVSDYTYEALLQNQLSVGGRTSSASTSNGMLIRATIDEAGQATVEPIYSAVPLYQPVERSEPVSDYAFELLAADGLVIGSYPAEVMRASEEGVSAEMLSVTVPGNVTAATLRLVHMGQVVAERPLSTGSEAKLQRTATDLEVEQDANGIHLSWGMGERPALVRYSADGRQNWTILGVDVAGGELSINPDQLPDNGQGDFQVIMSDSAEPLILTTPSNE
jgi:hypothetical protein